MPQTKTTKLQLSLSEFEELHELADKPRAGTIEIEVPRHSIYNLMMDNRKMFSLLNVDTYTVRPWDKWLYHSKDRLVHAVEQAIRDAPRKNSKLIAIDKKIVLHKLMDHSNMISKLQEEGYEFDG